MDFDTQQAQARLLNGTATQHDRDLILHYCSTRNTTEHIIQVIEKTHNRLCANCHHRDRDREPIENNTEPRTTREPSQLDTNALIKSLIYALAGAISVIGSVFAYFTKGA